MASPTAAKEQTKKEPEAAPKKNGTVTSSNTSGVSAYYPKVFMDPNAKAKMEMYVDRATGEISGLGSVTVLPNGDFLIDEIYIFKQESSSGGTELDPLALAMGVLELYERGIDPATLKLWWHSHGHGGTFWSGTDDSTMNEDWSESGFMLAIVTNKAKQARTRLDLYPTGESKVRLTLDNLPLNIGNPSATTTGSKDNRKEIECWVGHCKTKFYAEGKENLCEVHAPMFVEIVDEVEEKVTWPKSTYSNKGGKPTGVKIWRNGKWVDEWEVNHLDDAKKVTGSVAHKDHEESDTNSLDTIEGEKYNETMYCREKSCVIKISYFNDSEFCWKHRADQRGCATKDCDQTFPEFLGVTHCFEHRTKRETAKVVKILDERALWMEDRKKRNDRSKTDPLTIDDFKDVEMASDPEIVKGPSGGSSKDIPQVTDEEDWEKLLDEVDLPNEFYEFEEGDGRIYHWKGGKPINGWDKDSQTMPQQVREMFDEIEEEKERESKTDTQIAALTEEERMHQQIADLYDSGWCGI